MPWLADADFAPEQPFRWRTREGMKVAKAKGRLRGKQPKLSPTQEAHLVKLYRAGEHTVSELEELVPVMRSTIYRAVARAGGRTALAPAGDTAT
jgi:DNA invertase Pin-like site-specific DNA recombinase